MFLDILSQSFKLFLANPAWLIYGVMTWVLSVVMTPISLGLVQNITDFVVLLGVALTMAFIVAFLSVLLTVAISHVVYQRMNGHQASISDGFSVAFSRWVEIVGFIIVVGGILFFVIIFYSLLQIARALACVSLFLFIGLFVFSLGSLLVFPVITVEGRSGLNAYRRSAQLVNNSRGVVVGLIIVGVIWSLIISTYFNSIGAFEPPRYGFTPSLGIFDNEAFLFLYTAIGFTFTSIFTTVWYQKARERVGD